MCSAAVDQVVDCLDEIDCLTQPGYVDSALISQLLDDNRLLSLLEVGRSLFSATVCVVDFCVCWE